jgi:hypothetical protein
MGALETHEANLELRLTGSLILHLMWHLHYDARQFFLACESWDEGESLPRSALGLTVCQLNNNCSIQLTLTCPEGLFLGPPPKLTGAPMPAATRMGRPAVAGLQPTSNASIPPLCQKIVTLINRLYPTLSLNDLCTRGKVSINRLQIGRPGACINFGLIGLCPGCKYRHKVCAVTDQGDRRCNGPHEGQTCALTGQPGKYTGWPGPVTPPPFPPMHNNPGSTTDRPLGPFAGAAPHRPQLAGRLANNLARHDRECCAGPNCDWPLFQRGLVPSLPAPYPFAHQAPCQQASLLQPDEQEHPPF